MAKSPSLDQYSESIRAKERLRESCRNMLAALPVDFRLELMTEVLLDEMMRNPIRMRVIAKRVGCEEMFEAFGVK